MLVKDKFHHYDISQDRHWCPKSEKFAGVDHLLGALANGWQLNDRVLYYESGEFSSRPSIVYYFELKRGTEVMTMPVVHNPRVRAIIDTYKLHVVVPSKYMPVRV